MADQDPTLVETQDVDIFASDADDLGQVTDITICATNNNFVDSCIKQGKIPDDALRAEWSGLANIAVGDTIDITFGMTHNYSVMVMMPYDAAAGVLSTNEISYTLSGGSPAVFTFTQAFIDDLFDQGSGTWAARFVEDGPNISGDVEIIEVQGNLTQAGAARRRHVNVGNG